MKKLLKQLASESVVYGLSGMVTRFINIFLVPLYTRVLFPTDYGILNLVNTTFYFIGIFVIFSMDNSAARWYYDNEDVEEKKKPIATWFWFQLTFTIFISLLMIGLSTPVSKLILGNNTPLFIIIPSLTLVGSILPTIIWNWLRLQRRVWATVIMSTGNVLLTIVLNVVFILVLKMGIKGILLATLLSNSIFSIVAFLLMKNWLSTRYFNATMLKKMLQYALPLVPTSVAFWILNSSSAYFIKYFKTDAEVGLFSIAASIASGVGMIVGAFQMAWGPFAFSIMNRPEAKSVFSSVLTIYTIVASFTALAVALFAKEILILLTTPDYYSAHIVSGILAFNAIIYGYAYIGILGISIAKKTSPLAISVTAGAIITTLLFFFLVPLLGKEGAAISTLLGYAIVPIYVFYRSQKVWHIPFRYMPSIIIFFSAITLFIAQILLGNNTFSIYIFWKLILLLVFTIVVFITIIVFYRKEINVYLGKYNLLGFGLIK
jgi:O-antigen/teichoic acid export membrane protein